MTQDIFAAWDQRGHLYGDQLQSVCFERFPGIINQLLDNWQKQTTTRFLDKYLKKQKVKVLDIGCGWGRMILPFIQKYPQGDFCGVDPAKSMVALFEKTVGEKGRAYQGALPKLPFEDQSFDCVLVVTTLMYLSDQNQRLKGVYEIERLLAPGGVCVVIENNRFGHLLVTGFGVAKKLSGRPSDTGGYIFPRGEIERLFAKTKLSLLDKKAMPTTTIMLAPLWLAAKIVPDFVVKIVGKICAFADSLLAKVEFPSLYIGYCYKKSE